LNLPFLNYGINKSLPIVKNIHISHERRSMRRYTRYSFSKLLNKNAGKVRKWTLIKQFIEGPGPLPRVFGKKLSILWNL
jgi:hypothetical protein